MSHEISSLGCVALLRNRNGKEDADNVDEDTMKRGFVPIGQAVKNAEVRSRAIIDCTQLLT